MSSLKMSTQIPLGSQSDRFEERWNVIAARFATNDYPGALFMLRAMAEEGEWAAYVEIANLYELGGHGINRDVVEALRWYRRSILEVDDPNAHLGVGRLLYHGDGVERNDERAFYHLTKAGERPVAWLLLGLMNQLGRGTPVNLTKAKELYGKAAAAGYLMPLTLLGRLEELDGNRWKGLWLRLVAAIRGFCVALKNPHDERLVGASLPLAPKDSDKRERAANE